MEEGNNSSAGRRRSTRNNINTSTPVKDPTSHSLEGRRFSIEDLAIAAAGSSPLGKEKEEQKKRFETLCRLLNVDEETRNTAWAFMCKIPQEDSVVEHENYWMACALYVAGNKSINGRANGVSLSHMLRDTGIRMVDFFDPMKSFIALLQLGAPYEERLKNLEKKFVVITILFQKYEKVFSELLQAPTASDRTQGRGKKSDAFQVFCFGWTLFLFAKGKLFPDPPDLLNAFHLLLCSLNLLITHVPAHLRKITFTEPFFVRTTGNNPLAPVDTLAYLCELNGANYGEVNTIQEQLFVPLLEVLSKNNVLKVNSAKVPTEPALSKNFYLGGLAEGANLQKNKNAINKEYEKMYYDHGDFDERLFIDQIEQIGTPSKVTSQTRNYYHINSKNAPASPMPPSNTFASPYKHAAPSAPFSPMTTTLSTVQWLKETVSTTDDKPSATLLRFFKGCTKDLTDEIVARVASLSGLIPVPQETQDWAEKPRIDLGVKLYYRILESMLLAEETRLHQTNFTNLLSHENFHKSLLACCMEIVLFSYKMTHMSFPYVLDQFGIKSFDFFKIIESVVRHTPDLPKVLIKHMCSIEERILEQLAWSESSPLISMVKEHKFAIPTPQVNVNVSNALLSPNPKMASNGTSPQDISVLASPMPKAHGQEKKPTSYTLELFFRKIYHLAWIRSRDLCGKLQIHPRIYSQVWQAIVHVLSDPVCLMRNRHLDQIVLSSIYGVCRVNSLGITFRQIIDQYRSQPQASSKIFREVILAKPEEKGDVINFYNSVYIPEMEQFILQFQQNSNAEANKENANGLFQQNSVANTPGIPVPSISVQPDLFANTANLPGASPARKSASGIPGQSPRRPASSNLYLSPMRLTQRQTTPSSGKPFLYSFGESPAKDLQQINQTINTNAKIAKRPIKRLFADNGVGNTSPVHAETTLKRKFDELGSGQEKENEKNPKM